VIVFLYGTRRFTTIFTKPQLDSILSHLNPVYNFDPISPKGHVARMGQERGFYRVLVWKPEGKRPLGRPRRRWEENIKLSLTEVGVGRTGFGWLRIGSNGGLL
jgi:hypothetical protein